jgi:uncharacterized repeat protein (TIGR03806 family)
MRALVLRVFSLTATALALGCGDGGDEPEPPVTVTPAPPGAPWQTLAEWHLFADARSQTPADRVEPFRVNSPLWSDATLKHRFIHVPEGTLIGFQSTELWQFPAGAILVKTFGYPKDARDPALGERLLETRLLVHELDGWKAHTYVWSDDQKRAERTVAGATIPSTWIDEEGQTRLNDYGVPNTNQCAECHEQAGVLDTLGGRTRQLDRDGQIERLASLGWLDAAPPPAGQRERLTDPLGTAPLVDRARSYLDANCGHCHAPDRNASQSGLLLDFSHTDASADPVSWGVCKVPTSAGGATCGLVHDIVPGSPDQSILVCRMKSREPKVQMPPLATRLADAAGVALVSDFVASLALPSCP